MNKRDLCSHKIKITCGNVKTASYESNLPSGHRFWAFWYRPVHLCRLCPRNKAETNRQQVQWSSQRLWACKATEMQDLPENIRWKATPCPSYPSFPYDITSFYEEYAWLFRLFLLLFGIPVFSFFCGGSVSDSSPAVSWERCLVFNSPFGGPLARSTLGTILQGKAAKGAEAKVCALNGVHICQTSWLSRFFSLSS